MSKSHKSRQRRFVPTLERLEPRDQPAAVATQTGGVLTILGTTGSDTIRLGDDGMGNIAVLTGTATPLQIFRNVTTINVQLLTGTDSVHYDLLGPLGGTRTVAVTGTGSKNVEFYTNANPLLPNASLFLSAQVSGGNQTLLASTGNDPNQATVNGFMSALGLTLFTPFQNGILRYGPHVGSDIAGGARLNINLAGGSGNNTIGVAYQGIVLGTLNVNEQGGGSRRDTVAGILELFGDTTGTINANVSDNPGGGFTALEILENPNAGLGTQFTPTIHATLNGGRLNSVTRHTSNVTVLNSSGDTLVNTFD
jgi:hypothetical protein